MSLLLILRPLPTGTITAPVVDPAYWRGTPWIGHPKVAYPTDGALR